MLRHVGQELGHAEVGDGLDGRASAGSECRRRARWARRCAPPAWPARPPGRCRGPADGCRGRCRAARRWPPWHRGAPRRRARAPGRGRPARGRPRASPWPCPAAWPSATSWAWVPSCRSRSMRRSVAAEASTVCVLACSSERTRVAMGSGPSRLRINRRSTLTKPRMTQGAAKKKTPPRMKMATLVEEAGRSNPEVARREERSRQTPYRRARLRCAPKSGWTRQAKASHHRLKATRTPRIDHGTLRAR